MLDVQSGDQIMLVVTEVSFDEWLEALVESWFVLTEEED